MTSVDAPLVVGDRVTSRWGSGVIVWVNKDARYEDSRGRPIEGDEFLVVLDGETYPKSVFPGGVVGTGIHEMFLRKVQ